MPINPIRSLNNFIEKAPDPKKRETLKNLAIGGFTLAAASSPWLFEKRKSTIPTEADLFNGKKPEAPEMGIPSYRINAKSFLKAKSGGFWPSEKIRDAENSKYLRAGSVLLYDGDCNFSGHACISKDNNGNLCLVSAWHVYEGLSKQPFFNKADIPGFFAHIPGVGEYYIEPSGINTVDHMDFREGMEHQFDNRGLAFINFFAGYGDLGSDLQTAINNGVIAGLEYRSPANLDNNYQLIFYRPDVDVQIPVNLQLPSARPEIMDTDLSKSYDFSLQGPFKNIKGGFSCAGHSGSPLYDGTDLSIFYGCLSYGYNAVYDTFTGSFLHKNDSFGQLENTYCSINGGIIASNVGLTATATALVY